MKKYGRKNTNAEEGQYAVNYDLIKIFSCVCSFFLALVQGGKKIDSPSYTNFKNNRYYTKLLNEFSDNKIQ